MVNSEIIQIAKDYAINCHNDTNCKYGEYAYSRHLEMVVRISTQFSHLIPEDKHNTVTAACWCHDVIEDTRQNYNKVAKAIGDEAADLVYLVTNELGKNRKEIAERTYPKIRKNPLAVFIKLCDRYANTLSSKSIGHGIHETYKAEMLEFERGLRIYGDGYDELWDALKKL